VPSPASKLVVANISGFWGDRLSAAAEVVRGGPVDVITGDYLAELTMAILHKTRLNDPERGYVPTFLQQMEEVLGECLARRIRVVANAGGLNPRGLAAALERVARRLGLRPKIAVVEGDDLLGRLDDLERAGEAFLHLDRGEPLGERLKQVLTANAYLGSWGIKEALDRGADVVITGRVADAALVIGPAASHFGFRRDDWDRLAGAAAAGHVLECSSQATGGNYAFFDEVPSLLAVGFPLAEIRADGSFVITKHPGTGGLVSIGTVTAQLLYEIDAPAYKTPDVIAHFDSLRLSQAGPNRVLVEGARGAPPPETAKVAMNLAGGYRNTATVLLAGLDVEAKAKVVEELLFASLGGRSQFSGSDVSLIHRPGPDPASNADALAELRISVCSPDRDRVGKRFSSKVVELMLASVPGITGAAPPGDAAPLLVYWPTLIDGRHLSHRVSIGDDIVTVEARVYGSPPAAPFTADKRGAAARPEASEETVRTPLGRVFGARSGDKGGNANLGVWARNEEGFAFLRSFLTADRLKDLLPDLAPFPVDRYELPNLRAVNFVVRGLLGAGVSASTRVDPQAKTLGEYLRAKAADVPRGLLDTSSWRC
jgi:hypothetical protein